MTDFSAVCTKLGIAFSEIDLDNCNDTRILRLLTQELNFRKDFAMLMRNRATFSLAAFVGNLVLLFSYLFIPKFLSQADDPARIAVGTLMGIAVIWSLACCVIYRRTSSSLNLEPCRVYILNNFSPCAYEDITNGALSLRVFAFDIEEMEKPDEYLVFVSEKAVPYIIRRSSVNDLVSVEWHNAQKVFEVIHSTLGVH